jgi:hypothetical protein
MNILHIVSDGQSEYNSAKWRSDIPGDALRAAGHNTYFLGIKHWLKDTDIGRYVAAKSDVIVIQRVMVNESLAQAKKWREKGKIVILDWDDHYHSVEKTNPAYDFWRDGNVQVSAGYVSYKTKIGYDPLKKFEEGIDICSAGTVPSTVMVNDYSHYGNVFYLPNYINPEPYQAIKRHNHNGEIWIGWGGSLGHLESFEGSGIAEALRLVLQEHKNVRFLLIGDKRIAESIMLPAGKVIFRPYVAYQDWPEMLAQFDIAIAPLYGAFDKRRSFLKAVESSVSRIPLIATGDKKYPVYQEFFGSPAHIYIPSEEEKPDKEHRIRLWRNSINAVIANIDHYREKAAGESYELGMEYDVSSNVDNIIATYEKAGMMP